MGFSYRQTAKRSLLVAFMTALGFQVLTLSPSIPVSQIGSFFLEALISYVCTAYFCLLWFKEHLGRITLIINSLVWAYLFYLVFVLISVIDTGISLLLYFYFDFNIGWCVFIESVPFPFINVMENIYESNLFESQKFLVALLHSAVFMMCVWFLETNYEAQKC